MQRKTVLISLAVVAILVLASLSTAIIVVKVNENNGKGLIQWDKYNKYDDLVMSYGQKLAAMMPKQEVGVLGTLSRWYFDTSATTFDVHATV